MRKCSAGRLVIVRRTYLETESLHGALVSKDVDFSFNYLLLENLHVLELETDCTIFDICLSAQAWTRYLAHKRRERQRREIVSGHATIDC